MNIKKTNSQIISKKRVVEHGEVFTSMNEVTSMLDLVKHETERIDSRFLEPACGTGNFLTEILKRKLDIVERRYARNQIEYEKYSVIAISSIYGVDILLDNVQACRENIYTIFEEKYSINYKKKCKASCRRTVKYILDRNILWGNALNLRTPDDKARPLVFSEWSVPFNDNRIKRRDFYFEELTPKENSDMHNQRLISDLGTFGFIPKPFNDFPLINFLKLS